MMDFPVDSIAKCSVIPQQLLIFHFKIQVSLYRHICISFSIFIFQTLADAEKAAACYPYPWTSSGSDFKQPATIRDESFYKSYMDMTLPTSMRSNIPGVGEESVKLKKATDDLLNSTYSLMYEMEKIRKDREYREPRRLGRVA